MSWSVKGLLVVAFVALVSGWVRTAIVFPYATYPMLDVTLMAALTAVFMCLLAFCVGKYTYRGRRPWQLTPQNYHDALGDE